MIVIVCDACKKTKEVSTSLEGEKPTGWREVWSGRLKQTACGPDCVRALGRALIERFGAPMPEEFCLVPVPDGVLVPAFALQDGEAVYFQGVGADAPFPYAILPAMRWPEGMKIGLAEIDRIPDRQDVPFILEALRPAAGSPGAFWLRVFERVAAGPLNVHALLAADEMFSRGPELYFEFPPLHPFHAFWIAGALATYAADAAPASAVSHGLRQELTRFLRRVVAALHMNPAPWSCRAHALTALYAAGKRICPDELPVDPTPSQLLAPWPLKPSSA